MRNEKLARNTNEWVAWYLRKIINKAKRARQMRDALERIQARAGTGTAVSAEYDMHKIALEALKPLT